MEIELKPLVRNKLISLLQQKKEIDFSIQETVAFVIEANGLEINKDTPFSFTDDLSKLIVEVKPSAEK